MIDARANRFRICCFHGSSPEVEERRSKHKIANENSIVILAILIRYAHLICSFYSMAMSNNIVVFVSKTA